MKIATTDLPDVLLITPDVFADDRGFFVELFQQRRYQELVGRDTVFVQNNYCCSKQGTLRGLHYQNPYPQGKLVSVTRGEIYDVAVDLRVGSPTFGQWMAALLSAENRHQLYVPPGLAHGYCVLSESAEVHYLCTEYYHPESQHSLAWNDEQLAIPWPIQSPLLSPKDQQGLSFLSAPYFVTDRAGMALT